MATYEQVKPFDPDRGGTILYACLKNVRLGYRINNLYDDAYTAWQYAKQHPDRNFPKGVAVPIFYELWLTLNGVYKNYGHVAVHLPDGRIWTDGRYYENVDELNAQYLQGKGKYLGWSEDINGVRVAQGGTMIEPKTVISLSKDFGVPLNDDQVKYYSNHPGGYTELFKDFLKYNYDLRRSLEKNAKDPDGEKFRQIKKLLGS